MQDLTPEPVPGTSAGPDPAPRDAAREPTDGVAELAPRNDDAHAPVSTGTVEEHTRTPILGDGDAPVVEETTDERAPVEPVPAQGAGPTRRRARSTAGLVLAALGGIVVTVAILIAAGAIELGSKPVFIASGASAGVPTAPVTIEVWADFQCPYCGLFAHGIEPTLLRDYAATGRAVLRFRDYAFLGQESLNAAVAARCADRQGRFWAYHDLLYASQSGENQGTFAQGNLVRLAAFAGLDTAAFTSCLSDGTVATEVAAETKEGKSLGIESTPTVRIVGPGGTRILKGLTPLKTLTNAVDAVASGKTETSGGSGSTGGGASDGPESTVSSPSPSVSTQ